MLRNWVLGVGLALIALGVYALAAGAPFAAVAWLLMLGMMATVGILIERRGNKPVTAERPGPDWQVTDERFVDPETGKLVTVFYHPRTGERRYVGQ